jgi:hypothetical protein
MTPPPRLPVRPHLRPRQGPRLSQPELEIALEWTKTRNLIRTGGAGRLSVARPHTWSSSCRRGGQS